MWKPLPRFHSLFRAINRNKRLQLLFLIEQTVFVQSAHSYFSLAAKFAKSPHLKKTFKLLAQEEKDHFRGLLNDLKLTEDDLEKYDPSPGTTAIIAYLHETAISDPESLLVLTAMFETEPEDYNHISNFYRNISNCLGLSLKHFASHHKEDLNYGHINMWRGVFKDSNRITDASVSRWIDRLHTTKHMIELWYDSILSEANRKGGRKINIRMLLRPRPSVGTIYV
jgi:hypothetical protein